MAKRLIERAGDFPYYMAAKSNGVLPSNLPIMAAIFVVDKMDIILCDGENNWYREADKPVAAGKPISALF